MQQVFCVHPDNSPIKAVIISRQPAAIIRQSAIMTRGVPRVSVTKSTCVSCMYRKTAATAIPANYNITYSVTLQYRHWPPATHLQQQHLALLCDADQVLFHAPRSLLATTYMCPWCPSVTVSPFCRYEQATEGKWAKVPKRDKLFPNIHGWWWLSHVDTHENGECCRSILLGWERLHGCAERVREGGRGDQIRNGSIKINDCQLLNAEQISLSHFKYKKSPDLRCGNVLLKGNSSWNRIWCSQYLPDKVQVSEMRKSSSPTCMGFKSIKLE
jgi:hypothetical protein